MGLFAMLRLVRKLVSRKKRRLRDGPYDLDLAYITDQILAMGYPSQGREALYRNPYTETRAFLDERHGDKYIVYNLCSEPCRQYDFALFDGRVQRYPFADHNPPHFDLIRQFCEHAHEWMREDPQHVVAVHCKAGKGRTGCMICALLIRTGEQPDPDAALVFYGERRTHNGKGVTIPSQQRYIRYYDEWLHRGVDTSVPVTLRPVVIARVEIAGLPAKLFTRDLVLEVGVMGDGAEVETSTKFAVAAEGFDEGNHAISWILEGKLDSIVGEFRVGAFLGEKLKFFAWFCSEFVKEEEHCGKMEVDKVSKNKDFKEDFQVSLWTHR
jgi:phosphatidylinositol-3,4,5-trisphosphate 3-phosphatase/dual-specificity protein phosphatase PTEN